MGAKTRWWAVVAALAVLAAAFGGDDGGDTAPSASTSAETAESADDGGGAGATEEPVASGPVTSSDGVLVATPPAGSGPITVEPAEPIDALDGLGSSVVAYELGPDGSVFDEPVELRFAVAAATATSTK